MRALPAGIELERVRGAQQAAVLDFVLAGLGAYREWAPDWSPRRPSPDVLERLQGQYDDDERAWAQMALADGDVVGLVSLATVTAADQRPPPEGSVYLWQMFVRADWQGSGLAGALMDRVLEEARRRGYERIVLWTPAGAAQARRFYEREGFTPTGEEDPDSHFGLPLVQYGRDV